MPAHPSFSWAHLSDPCRQSLFQISTLATFFSALMPQSNVTCHPDWPAKVGLSRERDVSCPLSRQSLLCSRLGFHLSVPTWGPTSEAGGLEIT